MEFIVIMIVAVVTANSISDGSSTIQESKELKKIEQVVKPEAAKQEIARQEASKQEAVRKEAAKQEIERKEAAKQEIAKQEVARQEAAKQEIAKQEKINQSTINSDSLIEKAVNYFSQYYLIGLILAAIAYIYFRTRKKITLKEILARKEFNEKQQEQITEEIKPEPSAEPTTTEEVKPDSQSPESSEEEEKK
jgi:hypothetical protein